MIAAYDLVPGLHLPSNLMEYVALPAGFLLAGYFMRARNRNSGIGPLAIGVGILLTLAAVLSIAPALLIGFLAALAVLLVRKWNVKAIFVKRAGFGSLLLGAVALEGMVIVWTSIVSVTHGRIEDVIPAAVAGVVALASLALLHRFSAAPRPVALAGRPPGQPAQQAPARPNVAYAARKASHTLQDLYGNHELKQELADAAAAVAEKGKNGILLFGEPGTGKTAFAEGLAGQLDLPFISVTFGDMASKWINETTERLVAIFDSAEAQQPCVLFLDELEAVLKSRENNGGNYEEYERIVTVFLGRASALQGSEVILMGATNYVDRLDSAAIREGRFDFKINVPLPDVVARENLICERLVVNGCSVDQGTLDRLTRRWSGFNVPRIISCADFACEVGRREAGLPVTEADPTHETPKAQLEYRHFYQALRKVQGRKGGPPEGAKALADMFLDPEPASRLREIASQLAKVDEIERLGGTIPKGILFYGPPGTGKTATAMALARECGWSFIERNGRELMKAREVDKLRAEASDLRPAVVFLDEADDILAHRSMSGVKHVTNELLTLMDGAGGALRDVVWIAATNHPEGIDSAALRGGRFEQKIPFGPLSDVTLRRMVTAWAREHAEALDGLPETWAEAVAPLMQDQTPANVLSVLELANNMAVTKHVDTGASRAITVSHVEAAAAEVMAEA